MMHFPKESGFKSLGLVAGGGNFPILCAEEAKKKGYRVVAVAHTGETDKALEELADRIIWVHLGQLNKLIDFLKTNDTRHVIFAGTITKKRIFFDVRPDMRALGLWRRMDNRLDDRLLRAIASELESEGIQVLSSTLFLTQLSMPDGCITIKKPSPEQEEDIRFGVAIAKEIGRLDIGQCIVVKDKTVLAVEAIEGTDQTILRGGKLGGPGSVVIKICKPGQDTRFDLPSVGLKTLQTMAEVRAEILAVEAGNALLFDMPDTVEFANKHQIAIIGIKNGIH
ncbi:MAG: UDP-2,3-diacylglucosamine diphosphatase LpxI [Deltaproteobacteria bacterium]|jgi:hypothetical protein|nr:UDP-2,3-diacylglucosamine diphosphatase LpxI [Deltaproteobacteria bacterium]